MREFQSTVLARARLGKVASSCSFRWTGGPIYLQPQFSLGGVSSRRLQPQFLLDGFPDRHECRIAAGNPKFPLC